MTIYEYHFISKGNERCTLLDTGTHKIMCEKNSFQSRTSADMRFLPDTGMSNVMGHIRINKFIANQNQHNYGESSIALTAVCNRMVHIKIDKIITNHDQKNYNESRTAKLYRIEYASYWYI